MKIYIHFLAISFVMLFAFSSSAQQFKEKSDPEARKILKKLANTYDTKEGIYVKYKLTIVFGEQKEMQNGDIYQKGEQYHINNNGNEIICDGVAVWVYNKKQNEVQINDYDPEEEGILSPAKVLNIYKADKDFFYAITGADGKGYQIEFKPLDSDSEIMKIRIQVDKSKTKLASVKVFGDDGGRYSFGIESLKNAKIATSKFKFDKSQYPGVTVVDLRD